MHSNMFHPYKSINTNVSPPAQSSENTSSRCNTVAFTCPPLVIFSPLRFIRCVCHRRVVVGRKATITSASRDRSQHRAQHNTLDATRAVKAQRETEQINPVNERRSRANERDIGACSIQSIPNKSPAPSEGRNIKDRSTDAWLRPRRLESADPRRHRH
jgi:hypothetical protein